MNSIKKMLAVLICLLLVTTIAGCGNKEPENENDLQNEVDNVQSQIKDIANDNSKSKVGKYVTPNESSFTWENVDGGVSITSYTGSDLAINIPDKLNGMSVVKVGDNAFANSAVTGIKLCDSIVSLGNKAFFYCNSLVEFECGNGLKSIGEEALHGCFSLKKLVLNEGLEDISNMAFSNCTSLTEVSFPKSLKTIGNGSFCLSALKSISIPANVKKVEKSAFSTCSSLETIVIENGVEELGDKVFEYCLNLKKADIPSTVKTIGYSAFEQCTQLTINGESGSYIETYATENNLDFKAS